MKRPVQWSRNALDDLKTPITHIAEANPSAAREVADRIRYTGNMIGEMATGRPGRVTGTYEKLVVGLPYLIAYTITAGSGNEVISIVRVIHTSRDWPPNKWPERG